MTAGRVGDRAEGAARRGSVPPEASVGRLVRGVFEIRTLGEAEKLSSMLATQYPDPDRAAAGIWELLSNAIEHGNFEIDFATKSRLLSDGTFYDEVERRAAQPPYSERVAVVTLSRSASAIRLTVADAGRGFDFGPFLAGEIPADGPNGRGIAIAARVSFDELRYRGAGNRVDAVCRLARPRSRPPA